MNMNKALQNLYHAVSDETTTKVNISKLLVDIHYAITGKESENKNNWSKIVNSMADNWPEGGGGTSDFSTATVTLVDSGGVGAALYGAFYYESEPPVANDPHTGAFCSTDQETAEIILYKGEALIDAGAVQEAGASFTVSGNATATPPFPVITVTGDCTITVS